MSRLRSGVRQPRHGSSTSPSREYKIQKCGPIRGTPRTPDITDLALTVRFLFEGVSGSLGFRHAAQHPYRPPNPRASEKRFGIRSDSPCSHTDRMNDPVGELPTSQRTSLRGSPVAFRPSPLPRVGHSGVTAWTPPALASVLGPAVDRSRTRTPTERVIGRGGGSKNSESVRVGTPVAIC